MLVSESVYLTSQRVALEFGWEGAVSEVGAYVVYLSPGNSFALLRSISNVSETLAVNRSLYWIMIPTVFNHFPYFIHQVRCFVLFWALGTCTLQHKIFNHEELFICPWHLSS